MPAASQADKARAFRALHERSQAFLIPNPWNLGIARILERLGFEALATTSPGFAFSRGHATTEWPATRSLPTAAKSWPPPICRSPPTSKTASATIRPRSPKRRQAAAAGLAGCSIEDSTGRPDGPITTSTLPPGASAPRPPSSPRSPTPSR